MISNFTRKLKEQKRDLFFKLIFMVIVLIVFCVIITLIGLLGGSSDIIHLFLVILKYGSIILVAYWILTLLFHHEYGIIGESRSASKYLIVSIFILCCALGIFGVINYNDRTFMLLKIMMIPVVSLMASFIIYLGVRGEQF